MIAEIGLITSGIELGGWGYLYSRAKRDAINKNLTRKTVVKEYPVFDYRIKKLIGANPSKKQQIVAKRAVMFTRFFVSTRVFEYLIIGLLDSKSKLRKSLDSLSDKKKIATDWTQRLRLS